MKHLLIPVIVVAVLAGCASDPGRRTRIAAEESARLSAPTTPLSSYGKFELKPMAMGPEVVNDPSKVAVAKDLGARVQARIQPVLAQWNAQTSNSAAAGKTLIVQPRAMRIQVFSGATRFFAGAIAGDSSIDMDLELKDAATGKVVASPRIIRSASAMAGAWSVGATDRNLMEYVADIATQYLQTHRK
jgi:hypothetical protein